MGLFDKAKSFAGQVMGSDGKSDSGILDYIPGIGDARAQERANETNLELSQQNRDWMERMSNTAYQRGMEDMKKAGLNPMLAYQQGGASAPSSSAPTVDPVTKTALVDKAVSAFTGISTARAQQQQANTAQATSESTIALNGAQTANAVANAEKTKAETAKTIDSIKSEKVRRKLMEKSVPLADVSQTAAELVQKGSKRIERFGDSILKNAAKPSVNKKTLQYQNPIKKFLFGEEKQSSPLIKHH